MGVGPTRKKGRAWIWEQPCGMPDIILFPFTLLAGLYGLLVRLRILLYEKGTRTKRRVSCPLISIGNLTVGGTGKTPFTLFLAERLKEKGCTVGIVSRGYKGSHQGAPLLVTDGKEVLSDVFSAGDEACLMANRLVGVPVVVSKDRFDGCRFLLSHFTIDMIILDDGFQCLSLYRDRNLLLIDALDPCGNGLLLPRGPLREPLSAIRRADLVVFTRVEDPSYTCEWLDKIQEFRQPCLKSRFVATDLVSINSGEICPLSDLMHQPVLSFCGIGNPASFISLLSGLGAHLKETLIFEDHFPYRPSDMVRIKERKESLGVKWTVTTEKDAVKIKQLLPKDFNLWAVRISVQFWDASERWESLLLARGNG